MARPPDRDENLTMDLRRNVLIVDDNEMVRELTEAMLDRAGFEVQAAATPAEALELAAGTGRVDLLVTDVVMPEMNGVELADRLVDLHPETRVVFTSGYADDTIVAPGTAPDGSVFLAKPYTMAELLETAADVFAAAEAIAG
jgi:two-component system, cell cycle sensor histidine kinase and response regulator CckA